MNGREARDYIEDFTKRHTGGKDVGVVLPDGSMCSLAELDDVQAVHLAYMIFHNYEEKIVQEATKQ